MNSSAPYVQSVAATASRALHREAANVMLANVTLATVCLLLHQPADVSISTVHDNYLRATCL
jgi:hypothetical protein